MVTCWHSEVGFKMCPSLTLNKTQLSSLLWTLFLLYVSDVNSEQELLFWDCSWLLGAMTPFWSRWKRESFPMCKTHFHPGPPFSLFPCLPLPSFRGGVADSSAFRGRAGNVNGHGEGVLSWPHPNEWSCCSSAPAHSLPVLHWVIFQKIIQGPVSPNDLIFQKKIKIQV